MSHRKGGTRLYCPECSSYQPCEGVSPAVIEQDGEQRWSSEDFDDVHWFRRGRKCYACGGEFVTAECHERLLMELLYARERLREAEAMLRELQCKVGSWLDKECVPKIELHYTSETGLGFKTLSLFNRSRGKE